MQGQIELFRCKNIHGIRHKLHIFANRLLLRRDIQQSQCRSNHRIKIDSMLCPDVRIHKYLNKHGIQPLRQQPVLTELRHRHAGQWWQYDWKPSKNDKNDLHMDSPLCLQRLARSHQRNELQYHAFLSPPHCAYHRNWNLSRKDSFTCAAPASKSPSRFILQIAIETGTLS